MCEQQEMLYFGVMPDMAIRTAIIPATYFDAQAPADDNPMEPMVEATGQGCEAEETDMEFQAPPPGMLSYFTEPCYPRLSQWPSLVSAFGRGAGRYLRQQQWHDELEARFAGSPSAYQYGPELYSELVTCRKPLSISQCNQQGHGTREFRSPR